MAEKNAIIIKRVNKGGHGGGHGGAWKVAYADFVTAMMCFFLVMWLMGSDEETKASIASYFNNPSPTSPWRPELKDNENVPLGNQTGAGDNLLKGANGQLSEDLVKDPSPVLSPDGAIKAKGAGDVASEALSSADSMTFSFTEAELFPKEESDVIDKKKTLERLAPLQKVLGSFKGYLELYGFVGSSSSSDSYDRKLIRLFALQQLIVDQRLKAEEHIKTGCKKVERDSPEVSQIGKIQMILTR